jgi:hypothetical protein
MNRIERLFRIRNRNPVHPGYPVKIWLARRNKQDGQDM